MRKVQTRFFLHKLIAFLKFKSVFLPSSLYAKMQGKTAQAGQSELSYGSGVVTGTMIRRSARKNRAKDRYSLAGNEVVRHRHGLVVGTNAVGVVAIGSLGRDRGGKTARAAGPTDTSYRRVNANPSCSKYCDGPR